MTRKLKKILLDQLYQGATPKDLALAVSFAFILGTIPIMGATTILCVAVGPSLKLNHPTMQFINYLITPLQLILIPVFLRTGEYIFNAEPIAFSPTVIIADFMAGPLGFLAQYGMAGAMAVFAWSIIMPWFGVILFFFVKSILEKVVREKSK
ncbi:MAG: DUF2062 domain-containing protein [Bdellovibrionota bacterium]